MAQLNVKRCFFSIAFFLIFAPSLHAEWHAHQFHVMGTSAKVELWEVDSVKAQRLIQEVVAEMERVNQLMSPYVEASELSLLNRQAYQRPVKVSQELFELLQLSQSFSQKSEGAFDITFASVGYLYDYRKHQKPTDQEVAQLTPMIDYRAIELSKSDQTVSFKKPKTKIDLGGIAKGHAVDKCIERLKRNGVQHAFVQAGGDSRLLGDKRGRLWSIGIRHPRKQNTVLTKIPLENVAVSTSGDYERFYIEDGDRIHHIIDPKTGMSSKQSVSVTIIADDATTADALSTSVFVLGAKKGLALINAIPNVSAIIIDSNGEFFYSDDLKAQ